MFRVSDPALTPNEESQEDSQTSILPNKHDLVEPVVYKGGPMTSTQRNEIYRSHNLPGIGKRTILTQEEEAKKKVFLLYSLYDYYNILYVGNKF